MYQRYPAGKHETQVKDGVSGDDTCLSFVTVSDDDGRTWSKPRDVTPQVKRPTGATSVASGPGVGIQLRRGKHAGRIVFPFNQGPAGRWDVYAVYSDDGGQSWVYGDVAPVGGDGRGNEVQMVELSDGRVLLNSRGSSGKRFRKVAISADGGASWSELRDDPALPESQCQASILRYDEPAAGEGRARILFVNPAVPKGRTRGTVRLSEDDGDTWPFARERVAGQLRVLRPGRPARRIDRVPVRDRQLRPDRGDPVPDRLGAGGRRHRTVRRPASAGANHARGRSRQRSRGDAHDMSTAIPRPRKGAGETARFP